MIYAWTLRQSRLLLRSRRAEESKHRAFGVARLCSFTTQVEGKHFRRQLGVMSPGLDEDEHALLSWENMFVSSDFVD